MCQNMVWPGKDANSIIKESPLRDFFQEFSKSIG